MESEEAFFVSKDVPMPDNVVDLDQIDQPGIYKLWRWVNKFPKMIALGYTTDVLGFRVFTQTYEDHSRDVWIRKLDDDQWTQVINP